MCIVLSPVGQKQKGKKEEAKKIQEISIFVNRLFSFSFVKVGRDLKAVVEVGHWSLVVVTLVMTLVGWLGLVLVPEPSPEGHGAASVLPLPSTGSSTCGVPPVELAS